LKISEVNADVDFDFVGQFSLKIFFSSPKHERAHHPMQTFDHYHLLTLAQVGVFLVDVRVEVEPLIEFFRRLE